MLREIRTQKCEENGLKKRWFNDESMDLIVWLDREGEFRKFQLCYDKIRNEHALTWIYSKGFIHNAIDDGEGYPGGYKSTPILIRDGVIDVQSIIDKFSAQAELIDEAILGFVTRKLQALRKKDFGI